MTPFDPGKADALAGRIFDEINGAMSVFSLYIGYRMGLFRSLAQGGPAGVEEFAGRARIHERYAREWLEGMAAGGYIEHDSRTGQFFLTPEQVAVYLDPSHPAHTLPNVAFLPSIAGVLPRLMKAIREGGGVPYEDYGPELVEAQGAGYRPMFEAELVKNWIAAMPDVVERLKRGGRVLDVGCGVGWASVLLAKAFPEARIDGVDSDTTSIDQANRNAAEGGVESRVRFHRATIETAQLRESFDLATLFECLHDMAHPVEALRAVRSRLAPDGAVLITEEKVAETLEENKTPLGRLYYNFSLLHCLPQAMAHEGSAATGAVMKASIVRRYASEAGFSKCEVLSVENPLFRLYRLTP